MYASVNPCVFGLAVSLTCVLMFQEEFCDLFPCYLRLLHNIFPRAITYVGIKVNPC